MTADAPLRLPELEVKCSACNGLGGEEERRRWNRCVVCDGAGYIATEFGDKVLLLMRHNFQPMLEAAEER